jgi:hypothetical protein
MPARVKTVKAMKPYTCTKCHDPIEKGETYRYFKPGFRGRIKVRRCLKPECAPRRSELEDNKLSAVYEAQEDAETNIRSLKWDDSVPWEEQFGDIESALQEAAGAATDVADEYEQAIDGLPAMNEDRFGPWRDALTDWANELESWSAPDEPSPEPEGGSTEERREWLQECNEKFDTAIEDAIEVLGNLEV